MKTVLCSLVLCLVSCLTVAANQVTFYLDWQDQLESRLPYSPLTNIAGQNGEMMQIWSFSFDEVYIVQWQLGVPRWWDLPKGGAYSSTGVHSFIVDTLTFPGFDYEQPFYLFVRVKSGVANELLTGDTQAYSAWAMSSPVVINLPIMIQFVPLPWTLVD